MGCYTDEAPWPHRYNDSQHSYPKRVHRIDSDGYVPLENWEKTLGHLHKKETQEPSIKDSPSTPEEASYQIMAVAVAETHTHSDLHIAYSMVVSQTITQKIAPYSSSTKEKWSKTPNNLRSNQHTMQWAFSHQQYSPSNHLLFPPHAYQNNHGQALDYYQSYHYVTTK
jgi:hypothetical protein